MRRVLNPHGWDWSEMSDEMIEQSLYDVRLDKAFHIDTYGNYKEAKNSRIVVNNRTDEALAHVSSRYKEIQTKEILDYTKELLTEAGIQHKVVRVDNNNAYNNILIALPTRTIEPQRGDILEQYFIVRNHHGGMLNAMVQHFTKRLVCTNGATSNTKDLELSVWHKGNVERKLQDGLNIYLGNAVKAVEELYDWLGNTKYNIANLDTYLNNQTILVGEYWVQRIKEMQVDNTFFSLYQAFTNLITHEYGRTVTAKLFKFNQLNKEVKDWGKRVGYDIVTINI